MAHTSVTLWKVIEVCGVCVPRSQWVVYCVIHLVVLCNWTVRNGISATMLQSLILFVVFVLVCGGRGGGGINVGFASSVWLFIFNPLAPNDVYIRRTAQLTSRSCILNIYSTNILTEYYKHAAHSPFFLFKMPFIS